jgi:hypothetical protein
MGRVKSEMFEDDLGSDDELVAKPLAHLFGSDPLAELTKSAEKVIDSARIVDEIRDCEMPYGTFERQTFIREKVKELMNAINCK